MTITRSVFCITGPFSGKHTHTHIILFVQKVKLTHTSDQLCSLNPAFWKVCSICYAGLKKTQWDWRFGDTLTDLTTQSSVTHYQTGKNLILLHDAHMRAQRQVHGWFRFGSTLVWALFTQWVLSHITLFQQPIIEKDPSPVWYFLLRVYSKDKRVLWQTRG